MSASHLLRRRAHEEKLNRVAEVYDNVSPKYDENIVKMTRLPAIYRKILARVDLSQGTILELGAGTGLFGRALAQEMQQRATPPDSDSDSASSNNQTPFPSSSSSSSSSPRPYSITGIELSQGMAEKCRQTGVYEKIHHGAVQAILPTLGPFDHILSLSVLYFLPPVDFSLTMVRSFQLAQKSLVVWIDEIPETYNVCAGI
jgi:predicted TPR repeat methyltransferase